MNLSPFTLSMIIAASNLAAVIVGFWLKKFITDVSTKIETLTGSMYIASSNIGIIQGKVESAEKRIEKHGDAILKFSERVAVLENSTASIQRNCDRQH